jgi:chemotaxis protein methyltransferase WspC
VDICTRSIATARRAAYGANSFRGKDLAFRERYFKLVEGRHALAETVCAQVRFCHGNLFDPALLADECGYDFIFCRNVLIYFGDAERTRTIKLLGRLLDETGVLFVGPSESGVPVRENMVPVNMPLAFAFRKAAPAPASQVYRAQPPMRSVGPRPDARAAPAGAAKPKFAAAPRQGNKEPLPAAGAGNDSLAVAARLADQGRLQEAAEICKRRIEEHAPSAAAFYLLALVSDAAGRHLEARDYYRKTLYLDPDHAEALAHLAALFEMQGDTAAAKRMSDRARRATIRHLD